MCVCMCLYCEHPKWLTVSVNTITPQNGDGNWLAALAMSSTSYYIIGLYYA